MMGSLKLPMYDLRKYSELEGFQKRTRELLTKKQHLTTEFEARLKSRTKSRPLRTFTFKGLKRINPILTNKIILVSLESPDTEKSSRSKRLHLTVVKALVQSTVEVPHLATKQFISKLTATPEDERLFLRIPNLKLGRVLSPDALIPEWRSF